MVHSLRTQDPAFLSAGDQLTHCLKTIRNNSSVFFTRHSSIKQISHRYAHLQIHSQSNSDCMLSNKTNLFFCMNNLDFLQSSNSMHTKTYVQGARKQQQNIEYFKFLSFRGRSDIYERTQESLQFFSPLKKSASLIQVINLTLCITVLYVLMQLYQQYNMTNVGPIDM